MVQEVKNLIAVTQISVESSIQSPAWQCVKGSGITAAVA